MRVLALVLLAAAPACAQMSAPPSVVKLRDAFVETLDEGEKMKALAELARTPPVTTGDLQALFDLFTRFPEEAARSAALSSLELLDRGSPHLEPVILRHLEEPDPESLLFAVRAALRLRSPKAYPLVVKLAKRPFAFSSPHETPILGERNAWWVQYEALAALAQWDGAKSLPLLEKKASEAPAVARLMAAYLWKDSLPRLTAWSSGGKAARARAAEGLGAAVPHAALRESRAEMLKHVRNRKADRELRHHLAIKTGLCSTPEEIGVLLQEYESEKDETTRLMLSAALFASRDRQVIPLLLRHAKEHKESRTRAGARVQLKDMLGPAEYRQLLEWAAASDPDPDQRREAAEELKK